MERIGATLTAKAAAMPTTKVRRNTSQVQEGVRATSRPLTETIWTCDQPNAAPMTRRTRRSAVTAYVPPTVMVRSEGPPSAIPRANACGLRAGLFAGELDVL